MTLILATFLATLLLWAAFIAVATLKNKLFDPGAPIWKRIPFYAIGAVFWIVDVIYNKTYGAILFWEFGELSDLTFTSRLKHVLHSGKYEPDGWRFELAHFMCYRMVEPWDPDHCSLARLRT